MHKPHVDQALVDRVRGGDKAAFGLLVHKYQRKVLKLISDYVSDPTEALDVAQEAFVKAYQLHTTVNLTKSQLPALMPFRNGVPHWRD